MSSELARLGEFEAKKDIPRDQGHWTFADIHVGTHSEKRYAKLQTLPSSLR